MSDFALGIAPEHRVALVCALLTPLLVGLGGRIVAGHAGLHAPWAVRLRDGWRSADAITRWSAWSLLITAVVHLALPLGRPNWTPLSLASAASGGCAAWLTWRAVLGRPWRRWTALLCAGFLLSYAVAVSSGREDADQVGLATAVVELTLLALLSRRLRGRIATTAILLLFGTGMWLAVLVDHDRPGAGAGGAGHVHDEHVDRAQAGFVQHPAGPAPTAEQAKAAADLAARTKSATLRYRDIAVAEADGYRLSGPRQGLEVHLDHRGHQRDGRIVDPQAPEQLVYASVADVQCCSAWSTRCRWPAPEAPPSAVRAPNGTRTTSVSGCCRPALARSTRSAPAPRSPSTLTIPEMMHVWVVDPPGGPYAEHLDDAWVTSLLKSQR